MINNDNNNNNNLNQDKHNLITATIDCKQYSYYYY